LKNTLLLLALLTFTLLHAKVNFTYAENNPDHRLPVDSDEVLSFHSIIKEPLKAVVNISVKSYAKNNFELQSPFQDPFFEHFFGEQFRRQIPQEKLQRGLGSGVVLSNKGYIVTNYHVIKDADEILVTLHNDESEYSAKLIGVDKEGDLAVIKIEAKNLHPIKLAHAEDLRLGDVVFAIGNPFGIGETVTQGIISALNKHSIGINQYENFIQTDASINPGNSGGALIDSRGALIGINTAIISKSGGNNGIGLAIPVDMMQRVVKNIIDTGSPNRGFIGVRISKLTDKLKTLYKHNKGAVVVDVDEGGAAYKAGIQRGDLILKVGETTIDSPNRLQRAIANINPGSQTSIVVEREGQKMTLNLTPMSKESVYHSQHLLAGAKLSTLTTQDSRRLHLLYGSKGVLVESVKPSSKAAEVGLKRDDVIIQVDNTVVGSLKELHRALKSSGKRAKKIYINRRGYTLLLVAQ
jgi:serine protease Do